MAPKLHLFQPKVFSLTPAWSGVFVGSLVEGAKLELGQKVQISSPIALPKEYNPEAVKKAVRNLQSTGAFRTIKDPVAWQREIRKDRSLPGRD